MLWDLAPSLEVSRLRNNFTLGLGSHGIGGFPAHGAFTGSAADNVENFEVHKSDSTRFLSRSDFDRSSFPTQRLSTRTQTIIVTSSRFSRVAGTILVSWIGSRRLMRLLTVRPQAS